MLETQDLMLICSLSVCTPLFMSAPSVWISSASCILPAVLLFRYETFCCLERFWVSYQRTLLSKYFMQCLVSVMAVCERMWHILMTAKWSLKQINRRALHLVNGITWYHLWVVSPSFVQWKCYQHLLLHIVSVTVSLVIAKILLLFQLNSWSLFVDFTC